MTSFFRLLELIKFSHTVFALPFALIAMLVAARGMPSWKCFGWILLCMVSARTAAMAFNRFADWDSDRLNPRTAQRAELATRSGALVLCLIGLAVFIVGTWQINLLCFRLGPIAILLILGYSLAKRFTAYSHALLGLALSAAPMGAWAAVTGSLSAFPPWILAAAVLSWVFGFDLIYATQDVAFDRQVGLFSYPARYGIPAALRLAKILHLLTAFLLGVFGFITMLGISYWIAWGFVLLALIYEHRLTQSQNPTALNRAFFEVNATVGIALLLGVGFGLR